VEGHRPGRSLDATIIGWNGLCQEGLEQLRTIAQGREHCRAAIAAPETLWIICIGEASVVSGSAVPTGLAGQPGIVLYIASLLDLREGLSGIATTWSILGQRGPGPGSGSGGGDSLLAAPLLPGIPVLRAPGKECYDWLE
jgi:hypothetical protein